MALVFPPRCMRFEIEGGPDLNRLAASYSVIGHPGIDERVSVHFDLREGFNVDVGCTRGTRDDIATIPTEWFVNGLLHEDGSGHNHMLRLMGIDPAGKLRWATGFFSSGRRKGNLRVWDVGVTPPTLFALSDSDPSK